jgi:hypothetical protein
LVGRRGPVAALDLSEFENVEVSPVEVTIIPLGIFHSVISIPPEDESFLRLNFYSKVRWGVRMETITPVASLGRRYYPW